MYPIVNVICCYYRYWSNRIRSVVKINFTRKYKKGGKYFHAVNITYFMD